MALSNWDTFAMNEKGEPCKGEFVSPLGVNVGIYKNWIYVRDEIAWQEGGHFIKPTIMEIYDSIVRYKDVSIISKSEDGTIYMVAWSGWSHKATLKGITGIGCYGYADDKYVGVTNEQLKRLKKILNTEYECGWYSVPEEFKNIDLSKGKRFNQGDMFFHEQLGTDKQCSVIGDAGEPILSKALKDIRHD